MQTMSIQRTRQGKPPGPTVHLKGFASGIDFHDPRTIGMARRLMQFLMQIQPSRIVWDGDDYSKDSFTRLILHMHSELGDAVELVAFLRECDQERFSQSWEATGVAVSMYLCPSSLDWRKLGTYALEVTGSVVVVCYGGGGTVADEFAAKPSAEVKFNMFAISRPRPGSGTEQAALVGKTNASLQVFTAPMPVTRSNAVHKFIRSTDGGTGQAIASAPHLVRVHFKTWCDAVECDMDLKSRDPTVAHPEPRTKSQRVFAMMQKSIVGYTEEQFALFSRKKLTVRRDAEYVPLIKSAKRRKR